MTLQRKDPARLGAAGPRRLSFSELDNPKVPQNDSGAQAHFGLILGIDIGVTGGIAVLSAERLRELLDYDHETGVFRWRVSGRRMHPKAGAKAGAINSEGYRCIGINRRRHKAHRLAWLYMTGEWPKEEIDHKNRDRADNRFSNLRQATSSQNKRNSPRRQDNKSGFKGVCWDRRRRKWRAQISIPGSKSRWLGYFASPGAAYGAYCAAAAQHHGDFARAS